MLFLYQNAGGEEVDIGKTGQTLKRMARAGFSLQEVTSQRKYFQNNAQLIWIVFRVDGHHHEFLLI